MTREQHGERLFEALKDRFPASEIPALTAQFNRWREAKPLKNVRVLDATPLFFNTCVKHAVLLAGGADLTVTYCDQIPFDQKAADLLKEHEIPTVFNAYSRTDADYDVILDCGGIHRELRSKYGVAELTRSGVHYYENDEVKRNVYLTDSGTIKMIETCLGTGESCLRALDQLFLGPFDRSRVLIFGCGRVGGGIAMYFRREHADVMAVDDAQRIPGVIDYRDEAMVRMAVSCSDVIVTATGRAGAAAAYADDLKNSHAVLINMGVEDEFGPDVPETRVLNQKKPLNFILDEPTKTRYIDPTMALDNEAVPILLNTPPGTGLILPDPELEKKILDDVRSAGVINSELDMLLKGK